MNVVVPDPSLVLLIGPSGAGKSTFAAANFRPTEIISSDGLREMLADDADDQGASGEAFRIMALLISGRLRRRLLTVVDATNLRADNRRRLRRLAEANGVPAVAVAFDLPVEVYRARNARRPSRQVGEAVIAAQAARLREALATLPEEGFDRLYVLGEPAGAGRLTLQRLAAQR